MYIKSIGRGAFHRRCNGEGNRSWSLWKSKCRISNDKKGEIPFRRKTEVSRAMPISPGLVGVLSLSRTAKAMADAVNIPQLAIYSDVETEQ